MTLGIYLSWKGIMGILGNFLFCVWFLDDTYFAHLSPDHYSVFHPFCTGSFAFFLRPSFPFLDLFTIFHYSLVIDFGWLPCTQTVSLSSSHQHLHTCVPSALCRAILFYTINPVARQDGSMKLPVETLCACLVSRSTSSFSPFSSLSSSSAFLCDEISLSKNSLLLQGHCTLSPVTYSPLW